MSLALARGSLDGRSATPLYLQLAELIRPRSATARFAPATRCPPSANWRDGRNLARHRAPRHRDLAEGGASLAQAWLGHLHRPAHRAAGALLAGFSADMRNRGFKPGSVWIERAVGLPTPEEAMTLALSIDERVMRFARVRTADGEPLAIERATIPARLLGRSRRSTPRSMRRWRRATFAPCAGCRGCRPRWPPSRRRGCCMCRAGAAVLRIERRGFLADGAPVEFTRSAYRGDRYDFVTEARARRCAEPQAFRE